MTVPRESRAEESAGARDGSDIEQLAEELWSDGAERGIRLASFISQQAQGLEGKRILDLGCASGGITRALAESAHYAIGLDNRWSNVSTASRSCRRDGRRLSFAQANALYLPFRDNSFDVVLMSGLLEWMGFALPECPPRVAQLLTLQEAHRVAAPNGRLVIGVENRWFPKFLLRSPHQNLPLVLLLPSQLAWALPRWVLGARVHEQLHGPRALQRLLAEAGFRQTQLFIPLFGYQFPREIVEAEDRRALLEALEKTKAAPRNAFEAVASGGRWGKRWFRLIATLAVQRWFVPSLLVVGRKVR